MFYSIRKLKFFSIVILLLYSLHFLKQSQILEIAVFNILHANRIISVYLEHFSVMVSETARIIVMKSDAVSFFKNKISKTKIL